ncbi:copper amine oxidase N-terminal domain-containing protein [Aureibacillus halotolerans]|uniref:Copper amine oxidase-like protein n=1 Tax=Aureibacillus halotolerans TaxID=1508390 RepID=A0A4R6U0R1_9BACI|nr:copper amine oxidase N-terminal domain-containing protein [Aureibacillus halotolerans]TDQ39256.1 copper amine oxidase-like protein [Aureibacillus halotolerans]
MKKLRNIVLLTVAALVIFSAGAFAASAIKVKVDGRTAPVDAKLIDNTTYVPLRAVSEMLGADVKWDQASRTVNIASVGSALPSSGGEATNVNQYVKLDKVVQDEDSLRLYVTYYNESGEEMRVAESLATIVANGKQYDFDQSFNFDRWYGNDVAHASGTLQPGVSAESVIFFEPIPGVDKVNVLLRPGFEDFRFNDVKVQK